MGTTPPIFTTTVTATTRNYGPTMEERLTPSIARYSQVTAAIFQNLRAVGIGIVKAFDPVKQTVQVQLVNKELVQTNMGDANDPLSPVDIQANQTQIALLTDIPILLPGAGLWTITFPIQVGDECVVLFSDTEIDSWFQQGGTENVSITGRRHNLSDGIALFGLRNQKRVLANYSTTTLQIRNDDGTVVVDLADNTATLTAPSVVINTSGDVTANVQGNMNANVNGDFNIVANGDGKVQGNNMEVLAATKVTINGDTHIDGKGFLAHTHSGVTTGGGTSGPVTP